MSFHLNCNASSGDGLDHSCCLSIHILCNAAAIQRTFSWNTLASGQSGPSKSLETWIEFLCPVSCLGVLLAFANYAHKRSHRHTMHKRNARVILSYRPLSLNPAGNLMRCSQDGFHVAGILVTPLSGTVGTAVMSKSSNTHLDWAERSLPNFLTCRPWVQHLATTTTILEIFPREHSMSLLTRARRQVY